MRRIALLNTAFLGDTVLTLPLIRTLRAAWPEARLDFIVRPGLGALYAAQPELTRVLEFDKQGAQRGLGGLLRFGRALAGERYDLFIGAQRSARSALLALLSGAPCRVGYRGSLARAFGYTILVDRRFDGLEEIERLLELARPVCPPEVLRDPALRWPRLVLPDAALTEAAALWAGLGPGPVLGVHPGSVWATKRWTLDGFAAVTRLAAGAGARVLVFAGPGEEAVAAEVLRRSGAGDRRDAANRPLVRNLAGQLTLPVLAACLGRLDAYLSNDSGPLHLAWCQGTPVTALFGPTVREHGFFPRGPGATVCEIPLDCRPCGRHGHRVCPRGHHACMVELTPETVWADVADKLFRAADNA